jgi:hypothetical protein
VPVRTIKIPKTPKTIDAPIKTLVAIFCIKLLYQTLKRTVRLITDLSEAYAYGIGVMLKETTVCLKLSEF